MNPYDLTTLENLKQELKVSGTTDDSRLERLISAASRWIETQTNRKLVARKYNGTTVPDKTAFHATTNVLDEDYLYFSGGTLDQGGDTLVGQGRGVFYLPQWPVQANTVLTFALHTLTGRTSAGETWDTTSIVEWEDYVIERDTGKLTYLSGSFSADYRNYRIKCAAGYQVGDNAPWVPEDLELLCIKLVDTVYRNKANLQSESIGTWSRTFNSEKADPFVQGTLEDYSRISL